MNRTEVGHILIWWSPLSSNNNIGKQLAVTLESKPSVCYQSWWTEKSVNAMQPKQPRTAPATRHAWVNAVTLM